jgi:DNA-directed RNA polymerase subunit K/omega
MNMNFKSIKAEKSTLTRDNHDLEVSGTGNLFETIVVLSSRSNQLATEMKEELNSKLEEFITPTDSLEEVFENREQIEISKFYERLPKPHSIAMAELGQDLLEFNPEPESTESTESTEPQEVTD